MLFWSKIQKMQENSILALILRILQVSRIWMITGTFKTFFPNTVVVYFPNQEVCYGSFDFMILITHEHFHRSLFTLIYYCIFLTFSSIWESLIKVFWYSKNVLKRLYYDYYFQRQEDLWRKNALKTLPALLNSSNMLACGEDLGLIPSCVHPVCVLCFPFSWFIQLLFTTCVEAYTKIYSYSGYARTGVGWPSYPAHAQWVRCEVWDSV